MKTTGRRKLMIPGLRAAAILVLLMLSAGAGTRLAVTAEPASPQVAFGSPLGVIVTIKNTGNDAISLVPEQMRLQVKKLGSGGGSNMSQEVSEPLTLVGTRRENVLLQPGQAVTLSGSLTDVTSHYLGKVHVTCALVSDEAGLNELLPKSQGLSVEFETVPSALMLEAWSASSPAERAKAQQDIRELLDHNGADPFKRRWTEVPTISYLGGYGLPFLEALFQDSDANVRAGALYATADSIMATIWFNHMIDGDGLGGNKRPWAKGLAYADGEAAVAACKRMSLAGLKDSDPRVRALAVEMLTRIGDKQTLGPVRAVADDPDSSVRGAVQKYIAKFAEEPGITDTLISGLSDNDPRVGAAAVAALEHSARAPDLQSLLRGFHASKGEVAIRLIGLMFEQEDASLSANLADGFKERSVPERVAILTAIAGHTDGASLGLVAQGLQDPSIDVQRAALMRLIAFPAHTALPLVGAYAARAPDSLRRVAGYVRQEIKGRRMFPFLAKAYGGRVAAAEAIFPSTNGTVPMVSPDGQWIAYVETGWGRPGGTGGTGSSNLISIVHAIHPDGSGDRVISDMFLVSWLSDSGHVASAREGFAAISDLDGKVTTEFGVPLKDNDGRRSRLEIDGLALEEAKDWSKGELRHQGGSEMPHSKRLDLGNQRFVVELGEDAAFSPDGSWFGPRKGAHNQMDFITADGMKIQIRMPAGVENPGQQASWSPDGSHVLLIGAGETRAVIIDVAARAARVIEGVDKIPDIGSWSDRKARWNPWSKDGRFFTFLRKGQVWIAAPDGSNARQLTFDNTKKAFPTFSRSGKRIAYVAYQYDNRLFYSRPGPTDLWVVDVDTTMAARLTDPNPDRIHSLDWLDDDTVLFDRVDVSRFSNKSSLRRISMK